jgi:hypothetical protein
MNACSPDDLQGVNIMAFCKEYNAATAKMAGEIVPVEITVYEASLGCCRVAAGCGIAAGNSMGEQDAWSAVASNFGSTPVLCIRAEQRATGVPAGCCRRICLQKG